LLELLKEGRAEIRHGLDSSLIERERRLRQEIGKKAERHTRLLGGKHSATEAAAMEKEIEALATEYEQVQGQIRQASPRYAALTQPVPLTLKEIQSQVLDPDTLLLEYALGDETSFLWAVTPTSSSSFELPKRQDIEKVARELHETLAAPNQTISRETPEQRRERLARAEAEYVKKAAALSDLILRPVAAELKNKRLLIVSEGALQYVPFAALPEPLPDLPVDSGHLSVEPTTPGSEQPAENINGARTAAGFKPLVVDHEIVSLPSASVLAVLRQQTVGRKRAGKTLAVLADPVFSRDDPRLLTAQQKPPTGSNEAYSSEDLKRSATESGLPGLVRLRFSRMEADEISKLVADKAKMKALDFAANRKVATSEDLGQYRIVHFATHGLINNQNPELSGVVLSLVDDHGQPQNGFLRLYDIYNLKLSADLVVLSACQTALGKEVKGEGIVGLTRGFMYAGAPRVVASLWRVEDRATAQLMQRFYARMLGDGLAPAAALRAAQVSMLRENRWQSPYYWAAFTLQGEWK
jgi:CHAT domain-containing protein